MHKATFTLFLFLLLSRFSFGQSSNSIVVIEEDDNTPIKGKILGEIKFKDKGFKINCTYPEALAGLKADAAELGGNLIKITEHKYPDSWSTCHRVRADVYKVEDAEKLSKEIDWSADRPLQPADFKAEQKPNISFPNAAALTYSRLGFSTNRVTMFKKPSFFVTVQFVCNSSWMSAAAKDNKAVLQHEQKHFDLCEVYGRILYKKLTEANLNAKTLNYARLIYTDVEDEYVKRQQDYDLETVHGTDEVKQAEWNKKIADELQNFGAYADHNQ